MSSWFVLAVPAVAAVFGFVGFRLGCEVAANDAEIASLKRDIDLAEQNLDAVKAAVSKVDRVSGQEEPK